MFQSKDTKIREIFPDRVSDQVNKGVRMHEHYMNCKSRGKYFPYFKLKIDLYIIFIFFFFFFAFLTSENDVICTVTLRHLCQLWCVLVGYELSLSESNIFPSENTVVFLKKNTKNSIIIEIICQTG